MFKEQIVYGIYYKIKRENLNSIIKILNTITTAGEKLIVFSVHLLRSIIVKINFIYYIVYVRAQCTEIKIDYYDHFQIVKCRPLILQQPFKSSCPINLHIWEGSIPDANKFQKFRVTTSLYCSSIVEHKGEINFSGCLENL